MPQSRTLPDHATCATHQLYMLSCEDYEELLSESGGGCFICRFPAAKMPQRKLYIDHDGEKWAVRGLLCIRCNSGIDDDRQPDPPGTPEYLANAWYLRKLAERGLSIDGPEPPIGSIVRDHCGVYWHHSYASQWIPLRSRKRGRAWRQMLRYCGPLNMRVIQTWDGESGLDIDTGPARQSPTRGVLEKRLSDALALLESHDWCSGDSDAAMRLHALLDGSGTPQRLPYSQWQSYGQWPA